MSNPFGEAKPQPTKEATIEQQFKLPPREFTDLTVDEMFIALRDRIRGEKTLQMLNKAHAKFTEVMERVTPEFAAATANRAIEMIGDGQVMAAQILEAEQS